MSTAQAPALNMDKLNAFIGQFVTDLGAYNGSLKDIGKVYRDVFGAHYPAMTLVAVADLVEPDALVEIEATAVIPD